MIGDVEKDEEVVFSKLLDLYEVFVVVDFIDF